MPLPRRWTRRSILRGTAATVGFAGLGGCSVIQSSGGGDDGADPSIYSDWCYEPDADTARFSFNHYAEIAAVEGLPEAIVPSEYFGFPIEKLDYTVSFQSDRLYEGSFGADQFRHGLASEGELTLEPNGELDGYDVYAVADAQLWLAVRDGRAIFGEYDSMEQFLEAGAGDVDRLVDVNDDAVALTDELGTSHYVAGSVKLSADASYFSRPESVVASGRTVDYTDDTADYEHLALFASEDDVDEAAIRSDYEDEDFYSDLSSSTDGRFVTVSYTVPTSELA